MEILILKADEVRAAMPTGDGIAATKEAMAMYVAKKAVVPLRSNLSAAKGQALFMPGLVEEADALGVKIVSTYPDNPARNLPAVAATMVLLDTETGMVKCLMDGTELTRMRTGALAGAATDLLARKDAKVFLLIGTGGQAMRQLESVLAVRPIDTAYVFNRKQEKAEAFVASAKDELASYGASLVPVSDLDHATGEADIITAVTTAKQPVFDGRKVKAGCHINGVGAYTPQMIELPPEIVVRADKIFVDTVDGVLNEAGDMIKPVNDGLVTRKKIANEIGDAVLQKLPGRERDDEITLFKTTGSAVYDVVVAEKIFRFAEEKGIGTYVRV